MFGLAVVALLSENRFFLFTVLINNHGNSCQCPAKPLIQVIGSNQSKQSKKASFLNMCASPWYYIRSQGLEENATFSLHKMSRDKLPRGNKNISL
jgi:hypothetical protein